MLGKGPEKRRPCSGLRLVNGQAGLSTAMVLCRRTTGAFSGKQRRVTSVSEGGGGVGFVS
jgi:hypothetical protein